VLQYFIIFLLLVHVCFANAVIIKTSAYSTQSKNIQIHLESNQSYVSSEVETTSQNNEQSFKISISALHKKSCHDTFRYLSRYEDYKEYLSFIKQSKYDDQKDRVHFLLSATVLPFDMILNFNIPRITQPGVYPFIFDQGFLSSLKGFITVEDFEEDKKGFKCFVSVNANWKGPKSKIPDIIFELFTATIARIGIETLFKISGHHY